MPEKRWTWPKGVGPVVFYLTDPFRGGWIAFWEGREYETPFQTKEEAIALVETIFEVDHWLDLGHAMRALPEVYQEDIEAAVLGPKPLLTPLVDRS